MAACEAEDPTVDAWPNSAAAKADEPRAPYVMPVLVRLGSVRDLTLGTSGKHPDVGTHARA